MKILPALILAIFISACGKDNGDKTNTKNAPVTDKKPQEQTLTDNTLIQPGSILGTWETSEYNMGFDIKENGKVSSVNMATLDYNSWRLIENKLILNSTSKGVSNPVTVDEIYVIRKVTPTTLVVSPSNNPDTTWTYTKK